VSEHLDLVRSIYAAWERGDYSSAAWAHPDIEYAIVHAGGFAHVTAHGRSEMREAARTNIEAWASLRIMAEEYRAIGSERVLVLDEVRGRGKRSGLDIRHLGQGSAHLFQLQDGMVTRLVLYEDRRRALADLGLEE
jgi:ketosteroid isomerase-like protein